MSSNNFIQCIHSWNKGGSIISNYDISLLQPLSCKKKQIWKNAWLHLFFYNWKRVIHRMGGWNWNFESTQYLSDICQILCIYAIHGCKCSSEKYHVHWGMNDRSYFHDKETLYPEKSCSLRLNAVTYEEKVIF